MSLALNTTVNATGRAYVDVEIYPVGLHWFLNSLMIVVTICGMIGNGLVCYYFATKKVRLTAFNMLLLNLSLADLLADVFAYPQIFADLKMFRSFSDQTANIMCAFTIGITPFATVTYVSVITLSYISLNRYVSIKFPHKTKWFKSRRNTAWIIVLTWIFSITFVAPNAISFDYDPMYAICYRVWPSGFNGLVWLGIGILVGVIMPIMTMFVTFIATMRHFNKKTLISNEERAVLKRKKEAVILLGFLIVAILVCWSPSFIYLILSFAATSMWPQGKEGQYVRMKVIRVVFLIALTNSIADPFIYAYRNPAFNKCFRATLARFKCSKRIETRERRASTLTTQL
eukprot:gene8953-9908_t